LNPRPQPTFSKVALSPLSKWAAAMERELTVQIPPAPLFFFAACSPKPCTIKQICKKASQGSKKLRRKVCAGLGRLAEGKMEKWKKPAHTADCSNHVWM
jgi:hypothetical protein